MARPHQPTGRKREVSNVIEAIQNRVSELLRRYDDLGPVGVFAATMLRADVERADAAIASGDIVAMLRALEALKGCE